MLLVFIATISLIVLLKNSFKWSNNESSKELMAQTTIKTLIKNDEKGSLISKISEI